MSLKILMKRHINIIDSYSLRVVLGPAYFVQYLHILSDTFTNVTCYKYNHVYFRPSPNKKYCMYDFFKLKNNLYITFSEMLLNSMM